MKKNSFDFFQFFVFLIPVGTILAFLFGFILYIWLLFDQNTSLLLIMIILLILLILLVLLIIWEKSSEDKVKTKKQKERLAKINADLRQKKQQSEERKKHLEEKRRNEKSKIIQQKRNSKKLLKSWSPKSWKDYTKNVHKVHAEINGSFDMIDQEWNKKDMKLTIIQKIKTHRKYLSTYIDFETCMKIANDKDGKYTCSVMNKGVAEEGEGEKVIVYYQNDWYLTERDIDPDDVIVLIEETKRRKKEKLRRQIERARAKQKVDDAEEVSRERIPDEVQIFVWNRDDGKCVKCGSKKKLEYDHIIPLSQGGSNTARNIQLLCESCNRSKGAKIGG
jgi:5-methylcytosine-specific restriction endonuclease McrA